MNPLIVSLKVLCEQKKLPYEFEENPSSNTVILLSPSGNRPTISLRPSSDRLIVTRHGQDISCDETESFKGEEDLDRLISFILGEKEGEVQQEGPSEPTADDVLEQLEIVDRVRRLEKMALYLAEENLKFQNFLRAVDALLTGSR